MDWRTAATRLLSGEWDGIAAYQYDPGHCAHIPRDPTVAPLPRATPESQGVRSAALAALIRDLDRTLEIEPHSLIVARHGQIVCACHWSPYRPDIPQFLYSLSKSLVATAIGVAVDDGLLDLDERAAEILGFQPQEERERYDRRVREITVRHLLTMTSGTSFNEALTLFHSDWVQAFFTSPLLFDPGSAFRYNSMNTYILAAILRARTGQGLLAWLEERVFRVIGISDAHWDLCPRGIEKGGWGLSLTPEDMVRIGQLYLREGVWTDRDHSTRVLSAEWIRAATQVHVYTEREGARVGYGFQIWEASRAGAYAFNGAFGQFVIVAPDLDLVVAMTAANNQSTVGSPAERLIWRHLGAPEAMSDHPLPDDASASAALRALARACSLHPTAVSPRPLAEHDFDGQTYVLERNRAGLLPVVLQTVYANFTRGNDTVRFMFDDADRDVCRMEISEGSDHNRVAIGLDGRPRYGTVTVGSQTLRVGAVGFWSADPLDRPVLTVRVTFIETPDTRVIRCTFRADGAVELAFAEIPTTATALDQINQLVGALDFANRRLLVYVLRRHGSQLRAMASNLLTPTVTGKADPGRPPARVAEKP